MTVLVGIVAGCIWGYVIGIAIGYIIWGRANR